MFVEIMRLFWFLFASSVITLILSFIQLNVFAPRSSIKITCDFNVALVIRLLDKLRKNITWWKKKKVCLFYLLQRSCLEVQRCS
jgi:hypothetical protein